MLITYIFGKIKYDPEFKQDHGEPVCNFTVEAKNECPRTEKYLVRCSCRNFQYEKMKSVRKGDFISGFGYGKNVYYPSSGYVFNIDLEKIELVRNHDHKELIIDDRNKT